MLKVFFVIFLFFIIPTKLYAETISTDVTVSADTDPAGSSKTITEEQETYSLNLGSKYTF